MNINYSKKIPRFTNKLIILSYNFLCSLQAHDDDSCTGSWKTKMATREQEELTGQVKRLNKTDRTEAV